MLGNVSHKHSTVSKYPDKLHPLESSRFVMFILHQRLHIERNPPYSNCRSNFQITGLDI
jgi:hypothetical protein